MASDSSVPRPCNVHARYHAHVYFDERSVDAARALCENAAKLFKVAMGRMHHRPVGPHPQWSCQLSFDALQFGELIPWLDAHRGGLNILVHAVTGNDLEDHTRHASWLGERVALNLAIFDR